MKMEKTDAKLATVGLSGVEGPETFEDMPLGKDLFASITGVKIYPTMSSVGQKYDVMVSVTVRNQGTSKTPACWLRPNLSVAANLVSPNACLPVPAMMPGQTAKLMLSGSVCLDDIMALAFVDCYNAITEDHESHDFTFDLGGVPQDPFIARR